MKTKPTNQPNVLYQALVNLLLLINSILVFLRSKYNGNTRVLQSVLEGFSVIRCIINDSS